MMSRCRRDLIVGLFAVVISAATAVLPAIAAGKVFEEKTAAVVARDATQATASLAEIDAIFAAWGDAASPGCALGVVERGELVYERGYGSANLDWRIPITSGTVFYVGSVSKQFTAAAVAMMALDGEISLDDDIRDYFPEMPAYERPITVRHLVHHTSGIRDIYTLMALAGIRLEDVFSDEDAISLIAAQRETNFLPGDEYLYSNSGYFLLAQLVERVTGKTLREYADERIFAPLGMRDSHFHDTPGHIVERRAISYQRSPGDPLDGDAGFRVSYLANFDKVGAGGLYTTVRDLLLWDRNLYTGDVGGRAFLELIRTPGSLADGDALTYAFGLEVAKYRGLETISHSGSMMGFKAAFLQFPGQRFSVLATCNLGDIEPMNLARRVADVYLEDQLASPADEPAAAAGDEDEGAWVALSADELSTYAGDYYSDELEVRYELVHEGDALWLRMRNTPARRLEKSDQARGLIRAGPWRLEFERQEDGTVGGFVVNAGRVTNIRFVRR